MKKVIIGLAIVAFFAIAIVGFLNQPQRVTSKIKDEEYTEIMETELKYDYPESPMDVVKAYCRIEKLLYSYKFEGKKASRFDDLINQQLELIDTELIDFNGGRDKFIISKRDSINQFLDLKRKVVDAKFRTGNDTLSEDNQILKSIDVIMYVNAGGGDDIYMRYILKRDDERRWKIVSYSPIEKFSLN